MEKSLAMTWGQHPRGKRGRDDAVVAFPGGHGIWMGGDGTMILGIIEGFPQRDFTCTVFCISGTATPVCGDGYSYHVVQFQILVGHLSRSSFAGQVYEQNDSPIWLVRGVSVTRSA